MIKLKDLLNKISYISSHTEEYIDNIIINDVCYDSRKAVLNTVFVCITGETTDGHNYAKSAYDNGCRVFIVTNTIDIPNDAVQIKVANSRIALAVISHNLFGNPAKHLKIIGITGTKGKTTIASLLYDALNKIGFNSAYIGTNGIFFNDKEIKSKNTTPESYELAKLFDEMYKSNVLYVIMEVSSQGVMMDRVYGIDFLIGVFTNLSLDHVGPKEHATFEDYKSCKMKFFTMCQHAIINADDRYKDDFINICHDNTTFAINTNADFTGKNIVPFKESDTLGVEFLLTNGNTNKKVRVLSPGDFSVSNALAVIAVLKKLSIDIDIIIKTIETLTVKGRMEIVKALDYATIIIDYAHNKLSFECLFTTLLPYKQNRLIAVFGSVGGRTQGRRKELAVVASKYCDFSVITSDNPDFENPSDIVEEIAGNFTNNRYHKEPNREKAVRYAIDIAKENDIIVFCGKGHEDFQLIMGENVPMSEKNIILDQCEKLKLLNIKSGGY